MNTTYQVMPDLTAEELRKNEKSGRGEREPCYVCGKHSQITQLHHVFPLKDCAKVLNAGECEQFNIPRVWLCPNCHAYIHKLIRTPNISLEKDEISESDMSRICEIVDARNNFMYRNGDKSSGHKIISFFVR